ncbi:transposase [Streptomyces sp. NPDC002343]
MDRGAVVRRHEFTDLELIPRAATGRPRVGDRQVINGMFYKIRSGISWQTVYTRFRRYAIDGVFTRASQQIQAGADAAGGTSTGWSGSTPPSSAPTSTPPPPVENG